MSQGDVTSHSAKGNENTIIISPLTSELTPEPHSSSHQSHPPHRILVTKCSSSPPRSRSQSAGSAHKEALLFFERHQLFQSREDKDLLHLPGSSGSSPFKSGHHSPHTEGEAEEKLLIRKRSARGRSHSQPSQVLLSTSPLGGGGGVKRSHPHQGGSGSGDHTDIQELFSGGSKRREKKCSSWLEQIQFTAQYQHYRTNDYASVVNSATSLDKAEGQQINRGIPAKPGSSPRPTGSSQSPHLKSRNGPHPLCFHFPRVKLPRIFNTKSLDDILGVQVKSATSTSTSKSGRPLRKLLSSTTSSSTSPHPTNLEIDVDPDLDSNSSVGITTPGITNTTGGTEGFTTTSGYFSDLDRRESCDLLVVDEPDYDGESHRRRHSSLVSYYEIKVGSQNQGGEGRKDSRQSEGLPATTPLIVKGGPQPEGNSSVTTRSRKWSGSSLQKSTSSLTSALLLRIPPFGLSSSDKKKSPKSSPYTKKETKFTKKKPSKSQSSGSLNRVSAAVVCANPKSARAKNSTTTNSNPIANISTSTQKQITKSDNYLNRIFGSSTAECSSTSSTSHKKSKNTIKSEQSNKKRRSSSILSEISSTTGDPQQGPPPGTQRKWTAVKHKWDLKLQLPSNPQDPENTSLSSTDSTKNPETQSQSQQRLLFIRSQIGQLVEAQARQKSLDLEASFPSSGGGGVTGVTRPHEPGRVSFRLDPEEIPDSTLLKNSLSSHNTTSTASNNSESSPVTGENFSREELLQFSRTPSQDPLEEGDSMTKSSNPHHFHYASNNSNKKRGGPSRSRNVNLPQHDLDSPTTKGTTSALKNKDTAHLVVANLSFLQRPISPCLLQPGFGPSPIPTPTPAGTPTPTSPGVFSASGVSVSGGHHPVETSSKVSSKSSSKTKPRNINEMKVISENINVGSGSSGCGLSCLSSRDDVLSPSNMSWRGGPLPLYGGEASDICEAGVSGSSSGSGTRFLQSQSQFGQGADPGELSRIPPDPTYASSTSTSRSRSTVDPSGRGTRFLQEEDEDDVLLEGDIRKMGDLQSPTYVKRTAHMFNNIYSSQNGSSPSVGEPHNPSYLNVSKSVSGYSCLSYNNNATTTNGTSSSHTTNGTSSCKTTTRLSNGASTSQSTSPYSHRFINGSGSASNVKSSSATSNRSEFRIRVNQREEEVGASSKSRSSSRDLALLSPTLKNNSKSIPEHGDDPEEPDLSSNYVPSHGKSFIMQRIERLYGSDAHAVTASTGIMTKKTVNPSGVGGSVTTIKFETYHSSGSASRGGKEVIIPIQVESSNKENKAEGDRVSSIRSSSIVSKDRDIIVQEDRSQTSPTRVERVFRGDEILVGNTEDESESDMKPVGRTSIGGGRSVDLCPGSHKLETITLDDTEKQLLMSSSKATNSKANGDQGLLLELAAEESTSRLEVEEVKPTVPLTKTKVKIEDVKDGNYFLQEMFNTVQELQRLCDKVRPELETLDQQSERAGNMLAAIGKSQLLIKKKFKQFDELCNANLRGVVSDEPETTNEDLAGFWDMVMIQVEQVYASFKDIEENNSDEVTDSPPKKAISISSPRKTASTVAGSKPSASKSQASAAAKARDESRRKLLAEKRRQMKDQTQDQGTGIKAQEDIVIFTPDNS